MWFSNDSRKTDNKAFTPIIHIIRPATCSTQGKGGWGGNRAYKVGLVLILFSLLEKTGAWREIFKPIPIKRSRVITFNSSFENCSNLFIYLFYFITFALNTDT